MSTYDITSSEATMLRTLGCVILALSLVPTDGVGQAHRSLVEGDRVQVAHGCKIDRDRIVECRQNQSRRIDSGQVLALARDTLRVRVSERGTELAIPTSAVTDVWVVDGTKGNFWSGAAIGLLGGALIGGLIGSTEEFCTLGCSPATDVGVIIGAPAGFLLGGAIGATVRSDRWRPIPRARFRIGLAPPSEGMGLSVSLHF